MPVFKIPITGTMPRDLDLGDVRTYLTGKGYILVDGISREDAPDSSTYIINADRDPTADLTSWSPTSPSAIRAKVIADYRTAVLQVRGLTPTSGAATIVLTIQAYERATTNMFKLVDSEVGNAV